MEITSQRRIIEFVVGLVVLSIFGVLFYFALGTYQSEAHNNTALATMQSPTSGNFVEIDARVLSLDPVKGEMSVRLSFTPHGDLVENGELTHELALYVNSATGGQNRTFGKGKTMSPIDVTLDLDGVVTDYPFDDHEAFLELYLMQPPQKGDKPKPKPAPVVADSLSDDPAAATAEVPEEPETLEIDIYTEFFGSLPGYRLEGKIDPLSKGYFNSVDITIHRSSTIKVIVIFAMALMWMITLTVVFMLLSVLLRERKIEFGMFGFMAGFLFSFVAFRNAMPGVPPIGTLSDYLAFFWGYSLISLSLVILTITWLLRPAK